MNILNLITDIASQIRPFHCEDMPEVLEIERSCFGKAWTEEVFICFLGQSNCIGLVAEHDHEIVGFMIYELYEGKLRIINFAVRPVYQRQGVGSAMIRRLKEKLKQQKRTEIFLKVRESNLEAQLFFYGQGFTATDTLRGFYSDTNEDAYLFSFQIPLDDLLPVNEETRRKEC